MTDTPIVALTADIVSAFVNTNKISASDLPGLIKTIHDTLTSIGNGPVAEEAEAQKPFTTIRKSIAADGSYLISLEDGRRFKSMKRYLAGKGMTPDDYRKKWGLPSDYPMVAPTYAQARSNLAKSMGLGQGGRQVAKGTAPAAKAPVKAKAPAKAKAKGGKKA